MAKAKRKAPRRAKDLTTRKSDTVRGGKVEENLAQKAKLRELQKTTEAY